MSPFYFAKFNQCKDYIVFEFYFRHTISRALHPECLRLMADWWSTWEKFNYYLAYFAYLIHLTLRSVAHVSLKCCCQGNFFQARLQGILWIDENTSRVTVFFEGGSIPCAWKWLLRKTGTPVSSQNMRSHISLSIEPWTERPLIFKL